MRSAESAKNTAEMIEVSIHNADRGVEICSQVSSSLDEISESVSQVVTLVTDINCASKQQSDGVSQIDTAMVQMDQVTQRNAANAEESAGASEQLNYQARYMSEIVEELIDIVGRKKDTARKIESKTAELGSSDNIFHEIAKASSSERQTGN